MIAIAALALAATSAPAGDDFVTAATSAITEFATRELLGHYDVDRVEIADIRESERELGEGSGRYGFKAVRATVVAVRNQRWSESLNPNIPQWKECETSATLFLLCRPEGYRIDVALELEMASTTDGWKIMDRNFRSLRSYPFVKYLVCAADRPDASDEAIIRGCFASSPDHSLQPTRPLRRGSLRSVSPVGRAAELRIR